MTCRKHLDIDPAAYLADPRSEAWDAFRLHYPTCRDCSELVARWSSLERALRSPPGEVEEAHPDEERLVTFRNAPETLPADEREAITVHVRGCAACREGLEALASFDFSALAPALDPTKAGGELPAEPGARRADARRRAPLRARDWTPRLGGSGRIWLAASLAVIGVVAAWSLWPRIRNATPSAPLVAETRPSPVPSSEVEMEAVDPGTDPQAEPGEVRSPSKLAKEEDERGAGEEVEARLAGHPPSPSASPVLPDEAPGSPSAGSGPILVALAELPPPQYANWSTSRGLAGERATPAPIEDEPPLVALAPHHTGLVSSASPTLYWYAAAPTAAPVGFALFEVGTDDPLLELDLGLESERGIRGLSLADHGVVLQPGAVYQWIVSLEPGEGNRTTGSVSGGFIRRVASPEALAGVPREAEDARTGHAYAAAGLWYDAIEFFSRWIALAPDDRRLRAHRAALLDQAGLGAPARFDRGGSP